MAEDQELDLEQAIDEVVEGAALDPKDWGDEEVQRAWMELADEERERLEERWNSWPSEKLQKQGGLEMMRRRKLRYEYLKRQTVTDPETGEEYQMIGGRQPQGRRPRKARLQAQIADRLREEKHVKAVFDALMAGVHATDDPRLRVQAAAVAARIDAKDEELALKEDEFESKPQDELRSALARQLASIFAGKVTSEQLAEMIGVEVKNGNGAENVVEGNAREMEAEVEIGGLPQAPGG